MYNQKYVIKERLSAYCGRYSMTSCSVGWYGMTSRSVGCYSITSCMCEGERGEAAHAQQLLSLTAEPVQHSRFQTHRSAVFSIALPHPDIYTGGNTLLKNKPSNMSVGNDFGNPLRKFKLVFLGEQSGECHIGISLGSFNNTLYYWLLTGVYIHLLDFNMTVMMMKFYFTSNS